MIETAENGRSLRRVLVALEASVPPQDILEAAAELAACLEVSLMGLLIEDDFLHDLAQLPIAREVALGAADLHSLTGCDVDSHYARQAQRIRRDLEAIAQRRRLECSFGVQRSRGGRLGAFATRQDLLAMSLPYGKIHRPTAQAFLKNFLQSEAKALLALPARLHAKIPAAFPLVLLGDHRLGDPHQADLLALAAKIAKRWNSPLHLISAKASFAGETTPPVGRIVRHSLYRGEESSQAIRRAVPQAGLILLPEVPAEQDLRSLAALETPLLILNREKTER